MKELRRTSRVYKIAYGLTMHHEVPRQTSLCAIFWRTVWMGLVVWPTLIVLFLMFGTLVSSSWFLTVGYRPTTRHESSDKFFVPIEKWPEVAGRRIWPIWIWTVGLILFYSKALTEVVIGFLYTYSQYILWGVAVMLVLLAILVTAPSIRRQLREIEEWELIKDYLTAKKRRVCPIVPIEPVSRHYD